MARVFKTGITAEGNLTTSGKLFVNASAGDEGGEIFLNKPVTGTSIVNGVNIDVYQNKLRIWEDGGTNRGVYIDITTAGTGVGTNLLGTATDTNYYPSAIVFNAGTTAGPTLDLTMSGAGAPDLTAVAIPSASDTESGVVTTGSQTFAGTKTFNSTITGSISGNAGTATTLATARNINGVSFNGSADITVTAAAGTLTGSTLNSGVTASSLTSVGTIATGTWNATAIADGKIASALTGKTYNGLTVTSTTGTITLTNAKTLSVSNTLTLAGTDSTTMTFPNTSATIARTDTLQTFTGTQTFSSSIDTPGIARTGASSLALSTANQTGSAGHITITAGNSTSAGSGGNITLEVGTTAGAGSAGVISIGNTNTPQAIYIGTASSTVSVPGAINIGGGYASTGVSISTTGVIEASGAITGDGTVTGGNLTTGGTIVRTTLVGGGTTGASINNSGQFIRTTSSARYKQDITDAAYSYEDVLALSPKTFRLKDEAEIDPQSKIYGGLIAEDVHELESLRVFVNYKTEEDGSVIPDGIAYGEMVSALISALKHQDARIEALEAQVQALSN